MKKKKRIFTDKRPADGSRTQTFCRKFTQPKGHLFLSSLPSLCFCLHNALLNLFGASGSIKCMPLKQTGSKGPVNKLKELPSPILNDASDTQKVFKSQTPGLHPAFGPSARNKDICNSHYVEYLSSRMLFAVWRCSWHAFRMLKNHKNCSKQTWFFRDREVTFPQQWPFRFTTEKCQGNLAESWF